MWSRRRHRLFQRWGTAEGIHAAGPQHRRPQWLGPATRGGPEFAAEETDHGIGDIDPVRVGHEFVGGDPGPHQRQDEVPDDLRRRRHLDGAPQHPIGTGVGLLHVLEAVRQPEHRGLGAQVGQLPSGDLVGVDAARRARRRRLERPVHRSQGLPVRFQGTHRLKIEAGVQFRGGEGGDDGGQGGLAGGARHGGARPVDGVRPGRYGRYICSELTADRVVGVDVDRQVEFAAQCGDQGRGGAGAQETGHVLDRQYMSAGVDDPLGQP